MLKFIEKYALYIVFIISLLAMFISLYFSDILGWAPCVLCWYQRILIYPITLISAMAIVSKDVKVYRYVLPLSIIGTLVALFHNLLYWKIIPEGFVPCTNGISCTADYLQLYGFITIPFLSLIAFIIITVLVIMHRKYEHK
jgi:disulfide bond formation protein DsbB